MKKQVICVQMNHIDIYETSSDEEDFDYGSDKNENEENDIENLTATWLKITSSRIPDFTEKTTP